MKTHTLMKWVAIVALTLILGLVDWKTGYELNFFVFYFVPVGLAAWHLGLGASTIISVTSALVWYVADLLTGNSYSSSGYAVWNTIIRLSSFLVIGWCLCRIHGLITLEKEKSDALHHSLSEIKVLKGLLPVCAQCKKIRNKQGDWQKMEVYIGAHSDAQFTHGYCPDCARKWLEEAGIYKQGETDQPTPPNDRATL